MTRVDVRAVQFLLSWRGGGEVNGKDTKGNEKCFCEIFYDPVDTF